MAYGKRVFFEPVREVGFGSITGSYTAVGGATTHEGRIISLNNTTNVDLYFSFDGTNNHCRIAAGSFQLFDFMANIDTHDDDAFLLPLQVTFYVKQTSQGAPASGTFWIELISSSGGGT